MSSSAPTVIDLAPQEERGAAPLNGHTWWRFGIACGAGTVVGVAVAAVLDTGFLGESLGTALALLVVLAVPLTPDLASRVVTSLALFFGLGPLTWWVNWPVHLNHAAVLTGTVSTGLTIYVFCGRRFRARAEALVPRVCSTDWLLVGAALAATLATLPLTSVRSPLRALMVLLPGADNWAHYAMFANLRAYGAVPQALGLSPDGSSWAFYSYPKSFHALAATISELGFPDLRTGPESLVAYSHAVGLVVVLGTVMVTAAVIRLPGVQGRLPLAVPAVVMTWTALLWEPGQKVLANGFASFWVGAVAAASALLLSLESRSQPVWAHLAAVAGLLVCVTQTWTPLLIVAGPAALLVLVREPGVRRSALARWLPPALVLLACAVAVVKAVMVLAQSVSFQFLVAAEGGLNGTSALPTFLLLVVLITMLTRGRAWARAHPGAPLELIVRGRLAILLLSPVLGLASLTAFLILQLHVLGTTSYYFLKYLVGFELVLASVTPAVCVMLVPVGALRRWSGPRTLMTVAAAAVLATQLFAPLTNRYLLLYSQTDDGTAAISPPYTREGIARGVLAAAANVAPASTLGREYLPLGEGRAMQPFYPDAWYHAINATVTDKAMGRIDVLRVRADRLEQAVPLVREVLESDSGATFVVPANYAEPLRQALGEPGMAARVFSSDRG